MFKTKTYEKQNTKLKTTNGILIKYLIQTTTTNKSAESNEQQKKKKNNNNSNTNLKQSSLIFEFDAK